MRVKLSTKLISTYLGVGLVPLALIGVIAYVVAAGGLETVEVQGADALQTAATDQLISIREMKVSQVEQYFEERAGDLGILVENVGAIHTNASKNLETIQKTRSTRVCRLLNDMRAQLETLGQSYALRQAFKDFKAYHDQSGARHDNALDVSSEEYRAVYDKWYAEFAPWVKRYGYYDVFLICAKHGHVLFTECKESDLGANLGTGPLKSEGLGKLWRDVVGSGKTSFVDFEPYSPSQGQYAAFVGSPVVDEEGTTIAVIAFQLPTAPINAIVQGRGGLGKSGETYLVGRHGGRTSFRSDMLTMGDGKYVVGAEIQTAYIDKAIAGESGLGVFFDSAGLPVLVRYDPLEIEGLTWAQVTKMDLEECLSMKAEGEKDDFYTKYSAAYGYYDLFLFEPGGFCFYSVSREADYRTNLCDGKYADTSLGAAVRESLRTRSPAFGDFRPYGPSKGVPAAFLTQPVVRDGKVQLIVGLQLSDASISAMMSAGADKERTLEGYLVGPDGHMRSNSILNPDDYSVAASFSKGNVVETEAARSARNGETEAKVIDDYLGSRVVSAWAPVDIFGHRWAVICEVDEAVALAARTEMHETVAGSESSLVTWTLGSLTIVGLLVALLAWAISRSISKPLNRIINGLGAGAEQVSAAADQVSSSSQAVAEGASEQASSLEETSASLEEITAMAKQNTEASNEVKSLSGQAQSDAEICDDAMQKMSTAVDRIRTSADETAGIVKTIEEIAFQTNLLALNAAVEAARAGDAGKGFAVVAEEVRSLAQRAAEAARNTSELIGGAVRNAEDGVEISEQVAESLKKITSGARQVNQIAAEVAAASVEQSQGIEQVNTAVTQMDQVTQSSAANAEESASASEELSSQAAELESIVAELTELVGGQASPHALGATRSDNRTSAQRTSPPGRPASTTIPAASPSKGGSELEALTAAMSSSSFGADEEELKSF